MRRRHGASDPHAAPARAPGPGARGSARRGTGFSRRIVAAAVALVVAALAASGGVGAQTIGYTVQMVAVSDRQSALELIGELDGYPAYFVRATTEFGELYRVRAGAFGNREAAQRYAAALPSIGGTEPVPALAENIPTPLMPLQGSFVVEVDPAAREWRPVAWNDAVALRDQDRAGRHQARFAVVAGDVPVVFAAWRAAPAGTNDVLRVRDLPLWPPEVADASDAARRSARSALLAEVAGDLEIDPARLERAVWSRDGVPRVTLLERVRLDALRTLRPSDVGELLAVAAGSPAEVALDAPDGWLVGNAPLPEVPPASLPSLLEIDAAAALSRGGVEVDGDGWRAEPEGRFVRLTSPADPGADGTTRWRALVGSPLFAGGDALLVRDRGNVVLYQIRPR